MGLGIEDRLKQLLPARVYYPYKIAKLRRAGEPELGILRQLAPADCVAIDVGANRGCYSYALSHIARKVEAFEPHPALAAFMRRKLGANVCVHEVALSNRAGVAELHIPHDKSGADTHLCSSLRKPDSSSSYSKISVRLATIDEFSFDDVGFIKIDVEGCDLDVIEGAQRTIAQLRPVLLVELLTPAHDDPIAAIEKISQSFNYDARVMGNDRLVDARSALQRSPGALRSFNVAFTPQ